jgi:geranylgeranyl pyrophosphate synthase
MSFCDRSNDLVQRVESTLDALLPAVGIEPARLHEALRYPVFNGGKRIRPLLCYASAEALDLPRHRIDAMAASVELIHCYSLIHDDLPAMDDDDLRRGRPSVHRAFDEATAILAGDALQTLAFEALARAEAPTAASLLLAQAAGSRGMVGGQAMDLAFESTRPSAEALKTMYGKKTGALIRAAVMLPTSWLERDDEPAVRALSAYADSVGLAFQIVDDLLDIEGDTDEIGKPAGSDAEREKATWPAMVGIEAARAEADLLTERAWQALGSLPGDTDGLRWLGERILVRTN